MNRPATIDVLLVEDNDGDVILVQEALQAANAHVQLHVVTDGVSALDFVRRQNPRPHLILLDLNLPQKPGREVLNELKSDLDSRAIPIVVFTSSGALKDVHSAYSHASGYIQKPPDVDEFFAAIAGLERYWAQTVLLPSA
jgi:CheY-like chemotaxis protein